MINKIQITYLSCRLVGLMDVLMEWNTRQASNRLRRKSAFDSLIEDCRQQQQRLLVSMYFYEKPTVASYTSLPQTYIIETVVSATDCTFSLPCLGISSALNIIEYSIIDKLSNTILSRLTRLNGRVSYLPTARFYFALSPFFNLLTFSKKNKLQVSHALYKCQFT